MKSVFIFIIEIFIVCCFIQCRNNNSKKFNALSEKDTIEVHEDTQDKKNRPLINYHLLSVKENIQWLNSLTSNDTLKALLILNRVDKKHLLRQDTLIMPDTVVANSDLYSPFPDSIDILRSVNKIIFFSYNAQAFVVYENGIRIRWGAASLGKRSTPTPTGLYFTNWKSKKTTSTINQNWVMEWYFNIDNLKGISIHQYGLPGYPASHSCIRLLKDDAYWIYYWADQWVISNHSNIAAYGTPVIVYGSYPFGKRKPWLRLDEDNMPIQYTPQEISFAVDEFLQLILKRQVQRDSVLLSSK